MGSRITFKRPDGKDTQGYLAKSGRAGAPGMVVIQEWWGLQKNITGLCDRFAAEGFDALAPDLYAGTVVPYHDREAAAREMGSLNFLDATDQNVRGAAQYLKQTASKVGITGFCLGGAVTILAACRVDEFSAAAPFYGLPPNVAALAPQVRVPMQGHYANTDDWCPPPAVNEFADALKAAGKTAEFFFYDASHAFMNEERQEVYDKPAAEQAWARLVPFLKKHLG